VLREMLSPFRALFRGFQLGGFSALVRFACISVALLTVPIIHIWNKKAN
jgi:hypothetical protein